MTESSRDKTIEVMARALDDAMYLGTTYRTSAASHPVGVAHDKRKLERWAAAALTAYESHLQASGMAVVPVEPTEETIKRMVAHAMRIQLGSACSWEEYMTDLYRIALAASPYGKAVVQEASAEAQSAVANSNPVKERDDG